MENKLFKRQLSLSNFTSHHQSLLNNSCISIIGCGGLGCSVALFLTGAGIGNISFIDGDIIDIHNIHRQIAYSIDDIGLFKVDVLSSKCLKINPKLKYEKYNTFIDEKNIYNILKKTDVVIDCSDNSSTRILLNNYCKEYKKPLIFGSALGYDGQLCVFDFRKSNSKCIFCLFPYIDKVNDTCSSSGVLGPVPGIIGNLQAIECLKIITGIGEPIQDLLHYSSLDTSFTYLKSKNCNHNIHSYMEDMEMTYETYRLNKDKYVLYDIRENLGEHDEEILGSYNEPNLTMEMIDKNKNIAVICEIGERSKTIIKEWREKGFKDCWSIKNGFRGI